MERELYAIGGLAGGYAMPDMPEYPHTPLGVGSMGNNVLIIQRCLNAASDGEPSVPAVAVDGVFGTRTEKSVKAFQRRFDLVQDGVIGPDTWDALVSAYAAARSSGQESTAAAQIYGRETTADAQIYGRKTTAAAPETVGDMYQQPIKSPQNSIYPLKAPLLLLMYGLQGKRAAPRFNSPGAYRCHSRWS